VRCGAARVAVDRLVVLLGGGRAERVSQPRSLGRTSVQFFGRVTTCSRYVVTLPPQKKTTTIRHRRYRQKTSADRVTFVFGTVFHKSPSGMEESSSSSSSVLQRLKYVYRGKPPPKTGRSNRTGPVWRAHKREPLGAGYRSVYLIIIEIIIIMQQQCAVIHPRSARFIHETRAPLVISSVVVVVVYRGIPTT